jgi:hypothetical protein
MRKSTSRASRAILHVVVAASVGILWAGVCAGQATGATAADQAAHPGIWKAAVPKQPMRGEFDNCDPLGVAAGARIKADCSLNWSDPDDGRLYCFSSGTSFEVFMETPHTNIQRARLGWQVLAAATQ